MSLLLGKSITIANLRDYIPATKARIIMTIDYRIVFNRIKDIYEYNIPPYPIMHHIFEHLLLIYFLILNL